MDGPDVPPFFICPISLQIMKDPVTISTGMTYDRESIQKWLLTYNNKSCPVTKQNLTDQYLTPNSTLLRLIESWSISNNHNNNEVLAKSSKKIINQRLKPTSDFSVLQKIIEDHDYEVSTDESNSSHIKFLRKIKLLVQENDNNGVYIQETHVVSLVVNLITSSTDELEKKSANKDLCYDCSTSGDGDQSTLRTILQTPYAGAVIGGSTQQTYSTCHTSPHNEKSKIVEEAMGVLYLIKPSTEILKKIAEDKNGLLIRSLSLIIQHGSYQARIESALVLKSIFKVVDDNYKEDIQIDLFEGFAEILKDQNSSQATKVVLSILIQVLHQFPKNGIKAVKVGVVWVLVELLAESRENKRNIEIMLCVLEQLCRTAEGRSSFLAHPASVAAVSSKILMVSQIANEKAVKILVLICRFCKNSWVVQELMEVGCVAKLFMVVQAECSLKTKEKAKEILGFHIKAWNKSPCFSTCFIV